MTAVLRVDPAQGLVRGVRAAVLTVPAVGAAAMAHASAGSCTSTIGLTLAMGVTWPAAVALLGRQRSVVSLVAWLVLVQAVTHVVLEQLCPEVMTGQMGLVQHLTAGLTSGMVALHAVSVAVTAVVLARADAGLWSARRLVRSGARLLRLVRALPPLVLVVVPQAVPAPPAAPVLKDLWKAPHPVRRGPPALLLAR